jgi:hypothetical protein
MLQAGRSPVRVPDEVDFFNVPNPSSCTMALGSIQPLTVMSTRNFLGVKSGWCIGLTLPPSMSRMSENVGASISRSPKGLYGLYKDKKKLRGFESASELYRSSDRSRSAKLVPNFSATCPSDRNFDSLDLEPLLFLPSSSSNCSRG